MKTGGSERERAKQSRGHIALARSDRARLSPQFPTRIRAKTRSQCVRASSRLPRQARALAASCSSAVRAGIDRQTDRQTRTQRNLQRQNCTTAARGIGGTHEVTALGLQCIACRDRQTDRRARRVVEANETDQTCSVRTVRLLCVGVWESRASRTREGTALGLTLLPSAGRTHCLRPVSVLLLVKTGCVSLAAKSSFCFVSWPSFPLLLLLLVPCDRQRVWVCCWGAEELAGRVGEWFVRVGRGTSLWAGGGVATFPQGFSPRHHPQRTRSLCVSPLQFCALSRSRGLASLPACSPVPSFGGAGKGCAAHALRQVAAHPPSRSCVLARTLQRGGGGGGVSHGGEKGRLWLGSAV